MALYSDTLDAVHYAIHLTDINLTNKTLKGYTIVTLVSKINSLATIKLELAKLNVDSVFVNNTKTTAFIHTGNLLNISLVPLLLNINDTAKVSVYYHGQPFVDPSGWGGFHFSGDYALNLGVGFEAIPHNQGKAWFPCIDNFRDRALYDVYLTVANDKKAISGGNLVGVINHGNNFSTWHWKTVYSLPTYLISATTGKYELVADTYTGQQGTIPITYYCRVVDTAHVAATFVNLKNITQVFENFFGAYPFERIGYTGTPGNLGAMEHASNISYPFSGWTGNTVSEWWYAHELSHMWFGNKVTCASAEDMWLNEGWAVWCESLYRESIYGEKAYKDNMRAKLKDVLQSTHILDGGYYPVAGIPQTLTYGNTVYQKGGQVAHTLKGYMGDDLFFAGVKAYLQQYAYNSASSVDLRDFLSAYSGIDLNPFFDAWVFAPGFPHFSIDSAISIPSGSGYDVTVFVQQKLKGTTLYANNNHLELTFLNNNWENITDTIIFSGKTGYKTFHLPFNPVDVMTDFDEKISDATTDLVKTLKSTGEHDFQQTFAKVIVVQVTDSAMVRITHNWVGADSLTNLQPGLRISDARYWTVEGVFPQGFKAKGKFSYSRSSGLDNTLITNSKDSLVILYRPDARYPWVGTPFTRVGPWSSGSITVDSLQKGDYTLAIWDHLFLDTKKFDSFGVDKFKIYPNPAKDKVFLRFESNQNTFLSIYDSLGRLIDKSRFPAGKNEFTWQNKNYPASVFYFKLSDSSNNLLESRKVIFE